MDESADSTSIENEDKPLVHITDKHNYSLKIYENTIVFNPPAYRQRYELVQEAVIEASNGAFTKVIDMGCSEMKFLPYLKSVPGVQEIVLMDKDCQLLKDYKKTIDPLTCDNLLLRSTPLNVKVVSGDACIYNPLLEGAQAVTLIELIEHMPEDSHPGLVDCIFNGIKPCAVIMTTPNASFNQHIPGMLPGTMRHWDHKFEWTTEKFQAWCNSIVNNFGNYSVKFSGIGLGPDESYCSQMAVFTKSQKLEEQTIPQCSVVSNKDVSLSLDGIYELLYEVDYPLDNRTSWQKDWDYTLARLYDFIKWIKARSDEASLNDSLEEPHLDLQENQENGSCESKELRILEYEEFYGTCEDNTSSFDMEPIRKILQSERILQRESNIESFVNGIKSVDISVNIYTEILLEEELCFKNLEKTVIICDQYAYFTITTLIYWVMLEAQHAIDRKLIMSVTVPETCELLKINGEEILKLKLDEEDNSTEEDKWDDEPIEEWQLEDNSNKSEEETEESIKINTSSSIDKHNWEDSWDQQNSSMGESWDI